MIDELLTRCHQQVVDATTDDEVLATAIAIIGLLGVAHPCGFESFVAVRGEVCTDYFGVTTPEDTRGLAASLLRAADEADAQRAAMG